MKLAIFLPTWIGDAVMATPALRALRKFYGDRAELVGIGKPVIGDLLAGTRWLDRFVPYDHKSKRAEERSWGLYKWLANERFDTAVLMRNSFREAAVCWLAGVRRRVGYRRYGRSPLLTDRLRMPTENGREIPFRMTDFYLDLAYTLGVPVEPPRVELATTLADEQAADKVWRSLGLQPGERVVTLNNSGAYGAAKLWPAESCAELSKRIANELGLDVLMICGPNERDRVREVVAVANHPRVHSLADFPPSLGLSKACVRRSRLFVTTDSGPRQFAAAFNVPIVGLFGATHVTWGENPFARERVVSLGLKCAPCQKHACPLGHHKCMKDLSVEMVLRAVQQQLGESRRLTAAA